MNYRPYENYKNSGLKWADKIPKHWDIDKAKYIFKKMDRPVRDVDDVVTAFRDGEVTLRKNRRTDGFTFSIKEIGYQGVRKGDLVIHEMDGFAGAIGVSDSDGKCSPIYSICKPIFHANVHYYAYMIREMAHNGFILSLAKGIRERSTDFRFHVFRELTLPIPPTSEQHIIASFLNLRLFEIDSLIKKYEKLIEILNEKRIALISHYVTKGLNPDIKMKNSGIEWIGEIPEDWDVNKLKYSIKRLISGGTPNSGDSSNWTNDNGIPWVSIADMTEQPIIRYTKKQITKKGFNEKNLKILPKGTILYSIFASLGKVAELAIDATTNQAIVGIIYDENKLNKDFLKYWLNFIERNIKLLASSNTQDNLNANKVLNMPIMMLSLQEQVKISSFLDKKTDKIDNLTNKIQNQIELLKEFKISLISNAVTGKIDLREINIDKNIQKSSMKS